MSSGLATATSFYAIDETAEGDQWLFNQKNACTRNSAKCRRTTAGEHGPFAPEFAGRLPRLRDAADGFGGARHQAGRKHVQRQRLLAIPRLPDRSRAVGGLLAMGSDSAVIHVYGGGGDAVFAGQ